MRWTDYSAGSKTPLTREVKLAPSADIAEAMIAENIKKGWTSVE